jgi:hypothetical protein
MQIILHTKYVDKIVIGGEFVWFFKKTIFTSCLVFRFYYKIF